MNQTLIIVIIAIVAFLVLTKIILWRLLKRQFGPQAQQDTSTPAVEHKDVVSSAVAAVEDISGPPDDLTRIKGLGPKAAAQLKLLGITRFAQLGGLNGAQMQSLDEQMGVFRGRLERDRWVDQARMLARGDIKSFEAEFGKLP